MDFYVKILLALSLAFTACEDTLEMLDLDYKASPVEDHGRRANIWYFGDHAGLDFNRLDSLGRPTVLTDGSLSTIEGTSVICDESGNLLFYTDGVSVWNRLHQVMPNGTGLHGNYSSTQSALIVPQPGSERYYYVFTTDRQGRNRGLSYCVVDIYANDGLGDIITKNIQLYSPTTEKLTAVHHANGRDIWVITSLYKYLVLKDFSLADPDLQSGSIDF